MKSIISLLPVFLVCLCLCACRPDSSLEQVTPSTVDTQQAQIAETTAEGYYVEKSTLAGGGTTTTYRTDSPTGTIVKIIYEYADGSYSEEHFDREGKLEYLIHDRPNRFVLEEYFYPSGNISKEITKWTDGSYSEVHFLDNGMIDKETGMVTSGTISYQKNVTADGQVEEITYDITLEDDGTYWFTNVSEDGTIEKTHFGTDNKLVEGIRDNEKTGDHTELEYVDGKLYKEIQTNKNNENRVEITYYESGGMKSMDSYQAKDGMRVYMEYYEDNSVEHFLQESDDGYKHEEKYNEAGYTTYYYDSNQDIEFFANDVGELLKCVSGGQTYEGDAIPSRERDIFNQVRQVPNEDPAATVETAPAETTSAFDSIQVEDGYYEEYYDSGKLKLVISKTSDMFFEAHYDEDGYWTYFHQIGQGFELEVSCDETGKVNKVLQNGVEQTDFADLVKDLNFRSW